MRSRANVNLIRALLVFGLCGVAAVVLSFRAALQNATVEVVPTTTQGLTRGTDAERWFSSVKSFCNPVEVATRMSGNPAPESAGGSRIPPSVSEHTAFAYSPGSLIRRTSPTSM